MLLQDFVYVDRSATQVVGLLAAEPRAWLSPLAEAADVDGDEMRVRVGLRGGVGRPGKLVRIDCSEPVERGAVTVVPISWRAGALSGAFPTFDGELEVAALGPDRCQMTLMGRYEPPLGAIGRRVDQLLLHRVAQARVRSFLGRLARVLEKPPPAKLPHGSAA